MQEGCGYGYGRHGGFVSPQEMQGCEEQRLETAAAPDQQSVEVRCMCVGTVQHPFSM